MNQRSYKNIKVLLLTFFVSLLLAFSALLLSGCNVFGIGLSPADAQKAAVTTYLAEVNALSKEFKAALSDFNSDIKEKNVNNMQDKLKSAQDILDQFNKLDVPSGCEDVQKAYSDGYLQLQQALSVYISIYTDFVNAQMDNSVLNERVASVQQSYNEGLNLIRNADQLSSNK